MSPMMSDAEHREFTVLVKDMSTQANIGFHFCRLNGLDRPDTQRTLRDRLIFAAGFTVLLKHSKASTIKKLNAWPWCS